MGTQDLNPAAPTQVGTGEGGQPVYEGNLNDGSPGSGGVSPGGSSVDDGASSETESPDAAAGAPSDGAPVDTGDATFVGAQTDPDPEVIPINGDSSTTEEQIYADPGLGDRGDPPPPPPPPSANQESLNNHVQEQIRLAEERRERDEEEERKRKERENQEALDASGLGVFAAAMGYGDAAPSPIRRWIIPAAAAGLIVLSGVAFAATRGNTPAPVPTVAPTASLAAPTGAPTATIARTTAPTLAPVSAIRVTDTRIDSTGNECLDRTTLSVTVQVADANPGDVVVFALSGPGLPSTVSAALDAKGIATATMGTVGPVKGTNTWTVGVQSIGGVPYPGGRLPQIAFCPNS